jgi:DNA-binding GntR family transcriptional regulator
MSDSMDHDSPHGGDGSFDKYRQGRKARENTRVIADMVYARLRDAILNAELHPNRRLVEDELADWLNTSRTPIREALLCLEKDGLVERNNGWIVREHSPAEIQARLECRLITEGYAARLAAARRSEAHLQGLSALAGAMEKPGISGSEFNQINDDFHRIIFEAAQNPTLTHLHSQTKMNYWGLGVPVIFGPEVKRKINEHHRTLIDALTRGDGDQAEAISRAHIQLKIEIILKSLGMMGQSFSP